MRIIRVLLLVLLTVMLPVRGVMAAAMFCPSAADSVGEAHAIAMSSSEEHADADGDAHHQTNADMGVADHHHDGKAGTDTCNLCAACCSVPPLPCAAPALPLPHGTASADFPAYSAPAPSFLSDGQERPPRSI